MEKEKRWYVKKEWNETMSYEAQLINRIEALRKTGAFKILATYVEDRTKTKMVEYDVDMWEEEKIICERGYVVCEMIKDELCYIFMDMLRDSGYNTGMLYNENYLEFEKEDW